MVTKLIISVILALLLAHNSQGQDRIVSISGYVVITYSKTDIADLQYKEEKTVLLDMPRVISFNPDSLQEHIPDFDMDIVIPDFPYSFDGYISESEIIEIKNTIREKEKQSIFIDGPDKAHVSRILRLVGDFVILDDSNVRKEAYKALKSDFSIRISQVKGFYVLKRIIECYPVIAPLLH
ncbi:MAG: hypothetical protein IJ151_04890 [Bacteroidales bacterium]|nr:hypothetical protein [Bacteroidales bacterium]